MARRYGGYTPARRQALRRAQLISAQKRHARRKTAIRVGVLAGAAVGGVVAAHKLSGSELKISKASKTGLTGRNLPRSASVHRDSNRVVAVVRPLSSTAGAKIQYRFGKERKVTINRHRPPVIAHVDTIPMYNGKSSRSWPHLSVNASILQNQKLRKAGLIR